MKKRELLSHLCKADQSLCEVGVNVGLSFCINSQTFLDTACPIIRRQKGVEGGGFQSYSPIRQAALTEYPGPLNTGK